MSDRMIRSTSFRNRVDAGEQLAHSLCEYRRSETVIIGLARGGVAVGYGVARALELPLRALVVRKVGSPTNPELAIGAVSETGNRWIDQEMVVLTGASDRYLQREIERQLREARRRQALYAALGQGGPLARRRVIVVDDGIATGASALVALHSVRDLGAAPVLLATPIASQAAVNLLTPFADRVLVLYTPEPFLAVGSHYHDFAQVSDAEVLTYLRRSRDELQPHELDPSTS